MFNANLVQTIVSNSLKLCLVLWSVWITSGSGHAAPTEAANGAPSVASIAPAPSVPGVFQILEFPVGKQIAYDLSQKEEEITLTFDPNISLAEKDLSEKLSKRVRLVSVTNEKQRTVIRLALSKGIKIDVNAIETGVRLQLIDPQNLKISPPAPETVPLPAFVKKDPPIEAKVNSQLESSSDLSSKMAVTEPSEMFHAFIKPLERSEGLKLLFSKTLHTKIPPPVAAVFVQRPYVWIILDHAVETHFSEMGKFSLPEGFENPEQLQHPTHFVLRMKIPYTVVPSIDYKLEEGWSVVLGNDTQNPTGTYPFLTSRLMASLAPPISLLVQMQNPQVVRFKDPERQAEWIVVPDRAPGLGLPGIFRYADFCLVKSLQGLVLEPFVSDLTFQTEKERLVISRPGGLHFSSIEDRRMSKEDQKDIKLFNFNDWQLKDMPFSQAKSSLSSQISQSLEEDRILAQLAFAQFLIANGNGTEALGALRLVYGQNQRLKEDAEFMALMGVGYFFNGEYAKALRILSSPRLPPEAELWRGAALISMGFSSQGLLLMEKHKNILVSYPEPLRATLALKGIGAAVQLKKKKQVESFFEILKDANLTSSQENQLRDYQNEFIALINPNAIPNPLLSRSLGGKLAKNSAEEELETIKKKYESKQFSLEETIHKLEALRLTWRGDFVEFLILKELANLYNAHNNFENSLESYERAMAFFPQQPEVPELKAQACEVFKRGLTVLHPAFRKIAFFYRFRAFLPEDGETAAVFEKLAKQLMAMGLSDQAVTILEKESPNYVATDPKFFISLAEAYLEDNQPDKTLKLLDSKLENLAEFKDKINYLKAQAFYEKGDYPQAISYLKKQDSLEALELKADSYWGLKSWDEAAQNMQAMVKKIVPTPPELVIRLTMALYQGNQVEAIKEMKAIHGEMMGKTSYASLFAILTQPSAGRVNVNTAFRTLIQVKDFENFSKALKSGKL
ncbi:MAG: tetratricopeptide repeat protein [Alphaproteobacteria bacterium]